MIRILTGNLFDSKAQTLVNTVNCVGVMGKGIALGFKNRFAEMFEEYRLRCARGEVKLGEPYLYKQLFGPWVLNFPTKDHWRSVSRLCDITDGLRHLKTHFREWGIESLAVPSLGCGNGGLEWRVVGPLLYRELSQLGIPIEIYAPIGALPTEMSATFLERSPEGDSTQAGANPAARIKPSWVAVVEILSRIDREPFHWPIGRIGFQKLAYFATQAGIPTGLQFEKGSYGPFSSEVRPMITAMVNNGMVTEERRGTMFQVEPGPTHCDCCREYRRDLESWEPIIRRVADLFVRLNTHRAEIAATVDFAFRLQVDACNGTASESDVLEEVMRWKQKRRPPLDRSEVAAMVRTLNVLGWIELGFSSDLPVATEASLDV